jgi:hypothetical protein
MILERKTLMADCPAANHPRSIAVDFFRGLALLIIYVNHVPGNALVLYTPSRFGLSDSAETFVFLSGLVAAKAYGGAFRSAGMLVGTLRVLWRCGQIYLAHLGLFFALAMICVFGNAAFGEPDYIARLNLGYFFDETREALFGLATLQYVPHYFDILPMYLVVSLWVPALWLLARVHKGLALGFSLGMYLAMWGLGLEFPADMHGDRPWFFNPFGWQLMFFTGFAFGAGWFRAPRADFRLAAACLAFIVLAMPFSPEPALRPTEFLTNLHAELLPWLEKTRFGPLRWLHFLALAYLMKILSERHPHWFRCRAAQTIATLGRQSLPIFLFGMSLSYVGGMAFDQLGEGPGTLVLVNAGGALLLLGAGQALDWLGSAPWKTSAARQAGNGGRSVLRRLAAATALGLLACAPLALSHRQGRTAPGFLALAAPAVPEARDPAAKPWPPEEPTDWNPPFPQE